MLETFKYANSVNISELINAKERLESKTNTCSYFGPHLTLDLSQCNYRKLSDLDFVSNLLNILPKMIGMTKITQPYVFNYSGKVSEDKGITGMVLIAESHISVHTFQEKCYAFVDLFSCKPFDYDFATNFLVKAFESKKYEKNVVKRGNYFPR